MQRIFFSIIGLIFLIGAALADDGKRITIDNKLDIPVTICGGFSQANCNTFSKASKTMLSSAKIWA